MTVWVDAWQLQCCGEQSSTGSHVSWTLAEPDADWLTNVLGTQAGVAVDAREEHHGGIPDGTPQTAGTVIAVTAVHVEFALALGGNDRMRYPVASSAVLTPVASADRWTPDRGDRKFAGYLVRITPDARNLKREAGEHSPRQGIIHPDLRHDFHDHGSFMLLSHKF